MLPHTFEEAFATVQKLANQFRQNESFYLKADYSEARARNEFINKFFIALGWDVQHEYQTNPLERDVEIEKGVDVEGRGKRADYAFFAPNFRDVAFFAEAKKPRGSLADAQDYFQTVRYGWHQKTPVAVLTDFKEFHILDCRAKPDIDNALGSALEKFHYRDYEDIEKFRRIYYIFARAEVRNGSIEKYVAALPKPKGKVKQQALFAKGGYQTVDEALLQDLDGYRARLASAFKRANPELDGYDLTEATQRTLDRLVFMRFLEDKLIEPDEIVERFAQSATAWRDFIAKSRALDKTYNGIIFKQSLIDRADFQVRDETFAEICESLSHVRSSYRFDLIPIHILGSIYERFLGKTIVATAKQARIEDKPEVRKAGGVYYTPEYIVRYIVENTVGILI